MYLDDYKGYPLDTTVTPTNFVAWFNRTTNDVKLFWMDPAGNRQSYGVIPAGGEREQNTYAGHVWLVTTGAGDKAGVFEALENGGDAVIGGSQSAGNENPSAPLLLDGSLMPRLRRTENGRYSSATTMFFVRQRKTAEMYLH